VAAVPEQLEIADQADKEDKTILQDHKYFMPEVAAEVIKTLDQILQAAKVVEAKEMPTENLVHLELMA
jgi:transcriptional regulator of heat shock response